VWEKRIGKILNHRYIFQETKSIHGSSRPEIALKKFLIAVKP
jgi:hypothetical protein